MAYPVSVGVTAGVGTGIAFDLVSGVNFQAVKIDIGATGVASLLGLGAPLPAQPVMGGAYVSSSNPLATMLGLMPTDLTEVAINAAANGDNSIVAAGGASNKIRLWAFFLKINGAAGVNLKWRDGLAGTDFHPALPFNDKDGWVMGLMGGRPWFTGTANTALVLNLSAAIQVSGRAYYTVGV